jgi:hypothetical protein
MAESAPAAPVDLQALVDLFTVASYKAEGHATGTHSGVAAVLEALSDAAQRQAARQVERYDHRSLYEFAVALKRAGRPNT